MTSGFSPKTFLRVAAVVMVASAMGGCSSVPDWMNPFGDSDEPDTASDAAPVQTADNGTTPDLANVPDRPAQTATPDADKQVEASLAADRARAKYSSDTLRGDATAPAAPPAAPSPTDTTDTASSSDTQQGDTTTADTSTTTATTADATPAPSSDTSSAPAMSPDATTTAANSPAVPAVPANAPAPQRVAAQSMPAVSSGTPAVPPLSQSAMPSTSFASASMATPMGPSNGRPAVPAGPSMGTVPGMQTASVSDAQLGFQPSSAPPLDASVAQFVSPAILNRYRQTSGNSTALASAAVPGSASRRQRGMGGPEQMTGSVVANLDSLSSTPAVGSSPSVYAGPSGQPASSVVFFPGDTTVLNAAAKARVRAAVQAYRAKGSVGFVRVVGHSSSRTGNMPLERHLVVIFEKSQQRASSVAQELIREGIPADKVLVEAVGDSDPVFYESMPKGEDGNRRAEIFLQS